MALKLLNVTGHGIGYIVLRLSCFVFCYIKALLNLFCIVYNIFLNVIFRTSCLYLCMTNSMQKLRARLGFSETGLSSNFILPIVLRRYFCCGSI